MLESTHSGEMVSPPAARMNMNGCLSTLPTPVAEVNLLAGRDYFYTEMGYGEVTISDQSEKEKVMDEILNKIDERERAAVLEKVIDIYQGEKMRSLLHAHANVEAFGSEVSVLCPT